MNPAIVLDSVTKSYGKLRAVDGVSLSVDKGELFGLIGPDGSGKSTIYRILATLMQPDSGRASVLGLDTVTQYSRLRHLIGYMPERFSLYGDLTVKENLEFFATLFGVTVSDSYDLIAPVFSQLARFPDRLAGKLSGGMKQKLALSCALIHRPEVLLLDEPTTGVDAVSRSEFWDMLGRLRSSGITILVSTSYMDEAARCDRMAMINGGRILATGTPAQLASRLDGRLYNAAASDMFRLLEKLRTCRGVTDCYTFGATLHAVVTDGFDPAATQAELQAEGIADARIYPATPDIEDTFIRLTNDTAH